MFCWKVEENFSISEMIEYKIRNNIFVGNFIAVILTLQVLSKYFGEVTSCKIDIFNTYY